MLETHTKKHYWFLRDFHDMRCKYDRVQAIIREQFGRDPMEDDVFIVMSRDRRKIRLFSYDYRSCGLYERSFYRGYQFMKVEKEGDATVYRILREDLDLLLSSPVIKKLRIR